MEDFYEERMQAAEDGAVNAPQLERTMWIFAVMLLVIVITAKLADQSSTPAVLIDFDDVGHKTPLSIQVTPTAVLDLGQQLIDASSLEWEPRRVTPAELRDIIR